MRIAFSLAGAAMVAASCYRLGVYACATDDNCVDGSARGVCEVTGFCAYPDDACPSGRRYDDLAGDGLADLCVPPDDGATSGPAPTATETADGSDGSDGDGTGDPPIPTCLDEDGDGFGEGDACAGPDCDDDNPSTAEGCLYIGPDGDDAAAGTRDAPWRTFARAVPELVPGATLVLLSGRFDPAIHGPVSAICSDGSAKSGTPEAPIFVRAEEERGAWIDTLGLGNGVRIQGCSHWRLRGLRVSGADAPDAASGVLVDIRDSTDVEVRRLLVHDGNRWFNSPLVYTPGSSQLLFEDCEAYAFGGTAFYFEGGPQLVLRRIYVHGRGTSDLPDCVDGAMAGEPECSTYAGADHALILRSGMLVENAVVEDTSMGMVGGAIDGPTVLGSAFLGGTHGVIVSASETADPPTSTDVRVEHVVAVGLTHHAVYLRSVGLAELRHVTGIGASALRSDRNGGVDGTPCPAEGCVVTGTNLLSIAAATSGMAILDGTEGFVAYGNSVASRSLEYWPDGEPIDDDAGFWRSSLSVEVPDMGLGADQCIAYVPPGSVMEGAGEDGANIGADLLYRYVEGERTSEPLWDPVTGAFPCGAVVEGVNDDPTVSCIGVHERLHIGTPGCPLPPDYG